MSMRDSCSENTCQFRLRRNWMALVTEVRVEDVVDYLFQEKVLSFPQIEHIKAPDTSRERTGRLLRILMEAGEHGFHAFCCSLKEDHEHILTILNPGMLSDSDEEKIESLQYPVQVEDSVPRDMGLTQQSLLRNIGDTTNEDLTLLKQSCIDSANVVKGEVDEQAKKLHALIEEYVTGLKEEIDVLCEEDQEFVEQRRTEFQQQINRLKMVPQRSAASPAFDPDFMNNLNRLANLNLVCRIINFCPANLSLSSESLGLVSVSDQDMLYVNSASLRTSPQSKENVFTFNYHSPQRAPTKVSTNSRSSATERKIPQFDPSVLYLRGNDIPPGMAKRGVDTVDGGSEDDYEYPCVTSLLSELPDLSSLSSKRSGITGFSNPGYDSQHLALQLESQPASLPATVKKTRPKPPPRPRNPGPPPPPKPRTNRRNMSLGLDITSTLELVDKFSIKSPNDEHKSCIITSSSVSEDGALVAVLDGENKKVKIFDLDKSQGIREFAPSRAVRSIAFSKFGDILSTDTYSDGIFENNVYGTKSDKICTFVQRARGMSRDYKTKTNLVVYDEKRRRIYTFVPNQLVEKASKIDLDPSYNPFQVIRTKSNMVVFSDPQKGVFAFDIDGKLCWQYGCVEGPGDGQLHHPHGLCCDPTGKILVADLFNERIVKLSPEGQLVSYITAEGDDKFKFPVTVEVTVYSRMRCRLVVGEEAGVVKVFEYVP